MRGIRLKRGDRKDTMDLIFDGVRNILTEKDCKLLEVRGLT
jgi:hypothetical protein